ncbi:MAG: hypothetical protein JRJ66_09825 [Deltaproteobacteria bacterium]|nr:hypothetical protein [Deltaproteobacteria bacterium]
MEENGDLTYWNIPVSRLLNKALEEAIRLAGYRTKTEFIRDARPSKGRRARDQTGCERNLKI